VPRVRSLPRHLGLVLAVVPTGVVAVLAIVLLGHREHDSRATSPTQAASTQRSAGGDSARTNISKAVLDYLLPRDGADFAAGQSLGAFTQAVTADLGSEELERRGTRVAPLHAAQTTGTAVCRQPVPVAQAIPQLTATLFPRQAAAP
jgi:hypothetical protein